MTAAPLDTLSAADLTPEHLGLLVRCSAPTFAGALLAVEHRDVADTPFPIPADLADAPPPYVDPAGGVLPAGFTTHLVLDRPGPVPLHVWTVARTTQVELHPAEAPVGEEPVEHRLFVVVEDYGDTTELRCTCGHGEFLDRTTAPTSGWGVSLAAFVDELAALVCPRAARP